MSKTPTTSDTQKIPETPKPPKGDVFTFLKGILDLDRGVNYSATIQEISEKKSMFGANAWMLICSIMIASIGLNTNSQAVIIGAMLISPLMSPILGIGMGIAINDKKTLRESLTHFGIAIVIAIITSTIFFIISPLKELTSEIQARTEPTILDVVIGIFGGIAGIISIARKDISTTLPGVAIATALMPPLCVTGFGIANDLPSVLLSSLYLFFLNAFFVAFATFLIIKYMRFPMKEYSSRAERRKNMRYIYIVTFIMIFPSLFIFRNVWLKANTKAKVNQFIDSYIGDNDKYLDDWIISDNPDGSKVLILKVYKDIIQRENGPNFKMGLDKINLKNMTYEFISTSDIKLDKIIEMETQITNLSATNEDLDNLLEKSRQHQQLISDLQALNLDKIKTVDYREVVKEVRILYPDISDINLGTSLINLTDTTTASLTVASVIWPKKYRGKLTADRQLKSFLLERIDVDSIRYISTEQ